MTTAETAALKQQRFQTAMGAMVADPRFVEFIDALRELRESAMDGLAECNNIASERVTLFAIGKIDTYKDIILMYDEAKNRAADHAQTEAALE